MTVGTWWRGPDYLKAIRGPLPGLEVMATGGVGFENMADWFAAGAACVGMGSELLRKDWIATGDMDAVAEAMGKASAAARP